MSTSNKKRKISKAGRRTQENYDYLTEPERVLRNPDMFVGSCNVDKGDLENYWSYYYDGVLTRKLPIPALYKIMDELIVNVQDVYMKNLRNSKELPVKNVWISADWDNNVFTVKNDGTGVPIEKHVNATKTLQKNVLCPELVFFHFGSGDNFHDERTVGGKNGYGAKLCGVFSELYRVSTCDGNSVFTMEAKQNMSDIKPANVVKQKGAPYTEIHFKVDMTRFRINKRKLNKIPRDTKFCIEQRIQDLCNFMPKVNVFYNNKKMKAVPLKKQAKQILNKLVFSHEDRNVFIAVGHREEDAGSGTISYVNGTFNRSGGKHVNLLNSSIHNGLKTSFSEYKKSGITAETLKRRLLYFVYLKNVVNAQYDGQCKDKLISGNNIRELLTIDAEDQKQHLNSVRKLLKEYILKKRKEKQVKESKKTDGEGSSRYVNVEDLMDARFAGGARSNECSLIITEGKSAARLALAMVPKDKYGVLPIRGKSINALKKSRLETNKNKEVIAIKKSLGLQQSTKSKNELRYGRLIIFSDQDSDGYHIRMLIISLFVAYWPKLVKSGFLWIFETPIVKAIKNGATKEFFDQKLAENHMKNSVGWKYKYYKGLGTSTNADAKSYFKNRKKLLFKVEGDMRLVKKAMGKGEEADMYRKYLASGEKAATEKNRGNLDFIVHRQFANFALVANLRKIPNMIDGLIPSMRKLLAYAMLNFKEKDNNNIVDRFANRAADKFMYHHGANNLIGVVVTLASDFVGGLQLPYFYKGGQFASRHDDDFAAGRYLKTGILPHVKYLFPPCDYQFYPQQEEEKHVIEPSYMVPILPMLMCNGHRGGLGVGFRSDIPPRHLKQIIRYMKSVLNGNQPSIKPSIFYKNFKGRIENGTTYGIYNVTNDGTFVVTELPIGLKTDKFIKNIRKHTSKIELMDGHMEEDRVHIKIFGCEEKVLKRMMERQISEQYVFFDTENKIKQIEIKEDAFDAVVKPFMSIRTSIYEKRKAEMMNQLNISIKKVSIKKFVVETFLQKLWNWESFESDEKSNATVKRLQQQISHVLKSDDFDVSIKKLNSTVLSRHNSKINELTMKKEELSKITVKTMWLKDIESLETELYGKEETIRVGVKRNLV